jgi:hypothetical protein
MGDKALLLLVLLLTFGASSYYLWEHRGDLGDSSVPVHWKAVYVCTIIYVVAMVLTLLMLLVLSLLI